MGTKYPGVSISGYNASPPSDDGSTASTNQLSWAKHLAKIGNPLKTLAEAINSAVATSLDTSCRVISSSDSTVAGDNWKTVQIASTTTSAITVSLMDAVTATNGYIVTVANQSAVTHTIGRVTASNTINTSTNNISILPMESITFIVNSAANGYIVISKSISLEAAATVTAHATTMNLWTASQVTLSGSAVTVTDIADAPYAGAVVWVKQNAAHVWTHGGGVFDIQGVANYTAASGDWIRIYALTTGTFAITIFKGSGAPTMMSPITNSLSGDVALNNTANYFDGPSVAQGTAGVWFVSGTVTVADTAGAAGIGAKLWDGTTVIASAAMYLPTTNQPDAISLSGYISAPAGNLRLSVRDATSTSGAIKFNSTGSSKDSTITAIRIA